MLRKDIISRVQKFYDERNASYRETLRKSLAKAGENEEIETIRKRINEIKAMSLTGEIGRASCRDRVSSPV